MTLQYNGFAVAVLAVATMGQPNLTYSDARSHVHLVRVDAANDSSVRADAGDYDINGGPKAYGTPNGYFSETSPNQAQEHVVYRAVSGHLYNVWKRVVDTKWTRTDLRARSGATARAAGDPIGWSNDAQGRQWVVYRAVGGQLHGLTWLNTTGKWKDINLSSAARTKALAISDPTMFVDTLGATPRPVVTYRSKDKHVHLLIWKVGPSGTAWTDADLTAASGFKGQALSKPYGWVSTSPATAKSQLNIAFRTPSGHVVELYGGEGQPWHFVDLTVASHATVTAVGDIQGTMGTDSMANTFEAVHYKGSDGQLHELLSASSGSAWTDSSLGIALTRLGLWLNDGQSAYTTYLANAHLWELERDWATGVVTTTDLTTVDSATTHPAIGIGGYFTPSL